MNAVAVELLSLLAGSPGECAETARSAGVLIDDWQYACVRSRDQVRLVAAMPEPGNWVNAAHAEGRPSPGPALPVRIWAIRGGGVLWETRLSLAAGDDAEVAAALDRAEEWWIGLAEISLGRQQAIRVSARLRWGEDFGYEREIAALLTRPPAETPAGVLWIGAGDLTEDRLGTCVLKSVARYRLVEGGTTLERRYTVRRQLPKPQVAPAVAADLRRRCLARSVPTRRFPVRPLATR